jgi:hypothetical protein
MIRTVVQTTLNGESIDFLCESRQSLLEVLREELGLTGTKYGCGIEVCGACTVLIDGEPKKSCDMDVSSAAGKRNTTIEGLSPDPQPPGAEGLDRAPGAAVRLLPVRRADVRGRRDECRPPRQRDRQRDRQPVRLRHLPAHEERCGRPVTEGAR